MSHHPVVSICLPTYNSREFLKQRVDSILEQGFQDWELIVCDSFSNDGTWEYFEPYLNDPRFRLYQIPQDGLFAGWNQCLSHVRGKYFYIATSDDTMHPAFLNTMVGLLESNASVSMATCNFSFINRLDEEIAPTQGIPSEFYGDWMQRSHRRSGAVDFLVHTLLGTSWTTITSALFHSRLLDEVGLFRVDGDSFADRFWAMSVALHSDVIHCPEVLATWRIHDEQSSSGEKSGWRRRNIELTRVTIQNHRKRVQMLANNDPEYEAKLLLGMVRYYEATYCLDRRFIRNKPIQFLSGLIRASLHDPHYALRRLQTGFQWEPSVDAHINELIDQWQLNWPPVEL